MMKIKYPSKSGEVAGKVNKLTGQFLIISLIGILVLIYKQI
jgi:hypothetical protein